MGTMPIKKTSGGVQYDGWRILIVDFWKSNLYISEKMLIFSIVVLSFFAIILFLSISVSIYKDSLHKRGSVVQRRYYQKLFGNLFAIDNAKIIVFDLETNGLNPKKESVLSCSAIAYRLENYKLIEQERFDRYYFPRENFHRNATDINGLTRDKIKELRGDCSYPKYFDEEAYFLLICQNASFIVAHNIGFDLSFISHPISANKICTMETNTEIVRAGWLERKKQYKWPNLKETADYFGVSVDIGKLHSSMYDVEITARILQEMILIAKPTGDK
jgi:DNA polymerase III alpha subunit (gram-positive type)